MNRKAISLSYTRSLARSLTLGHSGLQGVCGGLEYSPTHTITRQLSNVTENGTKIDRKNLIIRLLDKKALHKAVSGQHQ